MLLVGFMASGKSTVGRLLAEHLGWPFVDFDDEVERRSGRTVAALFREEGETAFRELEARVGVDLLERDRVVLASGGGWAATPERLEGLPAGTLTVWLDIDPEVAVRRAMREGVVRPLLAGPDPMEAARALSARRRPAYARADLRVDGGQSPSRLVDVIAGVIRSRGTSSDF